MSESPACEALLALFADLDAERWEAVAGRVEPGAQVADELTDGWLRGALAVRRYLLDQRGVVTDVKSTVSALVDRPLGEGLTLLTFHVTQEYQLAGDPRRERMVGNAILRFAPGHAPELVLLHLAPRRERLLARRERPVDAALASTSFRHDQQ